MSITKTGGTAIPMSMAELEELDESGKGASLTELDDDNTDTDDDDAEDKTKVPTLKKKVGETATLDDDDDDDSDKDKDKDGDDDDSDKDKDADDKDKDDAAGDDDDDANDVVEFYAEVDKKHGAVIEVDYGDTDPMSADGVYIREQAIKDFGADEFEKVLEAKYPDAYEYLLHLATGKSKEEFFTGEADELPTVEELRTDDTKQDKVILLHLQNKGLSVDKAKRYLGALSEEEKVVEAEEALVAELEAEKTRKDKVKGDYDAKTTKDQTAIATFSAKLDDEIITKGKIGTMTIPAKDRVAFSNFLKTRTSYVGDKFIIATEITDERLPDVIQQQFFAFKKGNLSDLVQEKATTTNTIRAKFTKKSTKDLKSKSSPGNGGMTLGEL